MWNNMIFCQCQSQFDMFFSLYFFGLFLFLFWQKRTLENLFRSHTLPALGCVVLCENTKKRTTNNIKYHINTMCFVFDNVFESRTNSFVQKQRNLRPITWISCIFCVRLLPSFTSDDSPLSLSLTLSHTHFSIVLVLRTHFYAIFPTLSLLLFLLLVVYFLLALFIVL